MTDGPLRLPEVVDEVDEATHLLVGVRQVGGEALHEPLGQRALSLLQALPAPHPGRSWRQHGSLGDDPECELAGERLVAPGVPPRGETATVELDPLRRCVVRRVAGARGEVEEERHVVLHGTQVAQVLDGAVGQVRTEVVTLVDRARRRHRVVVVEEGGHELMGLAAVEAVPTVEPASERPGAAWGAHVDFVFGAQVPLADRVGGVAVGAQNFGQEAVLAGRLAPVARKAGGEVGNPSHAAAVMVAAGEQAGAGRRAQRRGVEVGQADPVGGERVDDRCLDVRAVTTELRVPHVVEHDQDNVRGILGRCRDRGPPRLRVPPVVADLPPELDLGHRAPPE